VARSATRRRVAFLDVADGQHAIRQFINPEDQPAMSSCRHADKQLGMLYADATTRIFSINGILLISAIIAARQRFVEDTLLEVSIGAGTHTAHSGGDLPGLPHGLSMRHFKVTDSLLSSLAES
jgi:hypothetical protein